MPQHVLLTGRTGDTGAHDFIDVLGELGLLHRAQAVGRMRSAFCCSSRRWPGPHSWPGVSFSGGGDPPDDEGLKNHPKLSDADERR
jgi:hypothetical protein